MKKYNYGYIRKLKSLVLEWFMNLHFKNLANRPKRKLMLENAIFKYGWFLTIPLIIILISMNLLSIFIFHFNFISLFNSIFLQSSSYKWVSLFVTTATLLFGIHQYNVGKKINIGVDEIISNKYIGLQFISRSPNTEFVKIVENLEVLTKEGTLILASDYKRWKNVGIFNKWFKFNREFNKYRKWCIIPGNEIIVFKFKKKKLMKIITYSIESFYFLYPDRNLNIEDLRMIVFYKFNHKYLRHSHTLQIGKAAKYAFSNEELQNIINKAKNN